MLFLSVVLKAPLLGDDAFNSYMSGYMGYHGLSYLEFLREYHQNLVTSMGRWIPGASIMYVTLWTFTHDALTVKLLQVLAIALDIYLLFQFVRRIARSSGFALLTSLLVIATFQVRLFYDPVAGIVLHMQIALGLSLIALICFADYLENRKAVTAALAVAAYVAAGLTYETSYFYLLAAFAMAWAGRASLVPAVKATSPLIVAFAALVVKDLYFRQFTKTDVTLPVEQHEYALSLNPLDVLHTLYIQTIGSLPLEYVAFDPRHYMRPVQTVLAQHSGLAWLSAAGAFIVTCFVVWTIGRQSGPASRLPWRTLLAVGLLLMIAPGIPISLSPRWQVEVIPGMAYLPVYNAGFGTAIVLALIIWYGAGRYFSSPRIIVCLGLAYSAVLFTTFQANALTLRQFDPAWNWARENLTNSLSHGLIATVPENASIFVDKSYPFSFANAYIWDSRYLFYMYTHKKVAILDPATENARNPNICPDARNAPACIPLTPTFELHNIARSYHEGYVSLAQISLIRNPSKGVATGLARTALIMDRGRDGSVKRPMLAAADLQDSDFQLVSSAADYRLFRATSSCGPIRADAFADARLLQESFGTGFYGYEHAGAETWQWAMKSATLLIGNATNTVRLATFDATLQTFAVPSVITLRTEGTTMRFAITSPAGVPVHLRIKLAPFSIRTFDFETNAPKPASLTDPRDLHFRVTDPTLRFTGGAC